MKHEGMQKRTGNQPAADNDDAGSMQPETFSRREFLAGSAAAGAAMLLPGARSNGGGRR